MRASKTIIQTVLFAIGATAVVNIEKSCENDMKKDYQQKIEQADPVRYNRILQSKENSYITWENEYLKMKDSLKADSFYKEGYKAGQQNIRDSLNLMCRNLRKIIK